MMNSAISAATTPVLVNRISKRRPSNELLFRSIWLSRSRRSRMLERVERCSPVLLLRSQDGQGDSRRRTLSSKHSTASRPCSRVEISSLLVTAWLAPWTAAITRVSRVGARSCGQTSSNSSNPSSSIRASSQTRLHSRCTAVYRPISDTGIGGGLQFDTGRFRTRNRRRAAVRARPISDTGIGRPRETEVVFDGVRYRTTSPVAATCRWRATCRWWTSARRWLIPFTLALPGRDRAPSAWHARSRGGADARGCRTAPGA
jgi:hypothetical protein